MVHPWWTSSRRWDSLRCNTLNIETLWTVGTRIQRLQSFLLRERGATTHRRKMKKVIWATDHKIECSENRIYSPVAFKSTSDRLQVLVSAALRWSSVLHGGADMAYIPSKLLLRVTQKPNSHLEALNGLTLVTVTSGDDTDHWAGPGQKVRHLCGLDCVFYLWESLETGSRCVTVHVGDNDWNSERSGRGWRDEITMSGNEWSTTLLCFLEAH